MQKVILKSEANAYKNEIEPAVISYLSEGQVETYESFEKYSILAFDWLNIENVEEDMSQILMYIDKDDLFVLCENERSLEIAKKCFVEFPSNERALYQFFKNLFKGDLKNLEQIEDRISVLDDEVMKSSSEEIRQQIVDIRYEVMRLKKYYEQLDSMFEELCDDDNEVICPEYIRYFGILNSRTSKLLSETISNREYITQVRESYQAQIDIEQNRLMKIFTLVTSIFLPLTLIAGWYGMNLKMPEYSADYGYPVVIGVSILVCVIWFIYFKKKGWFKG